MTVSPAVPTTDAWNFNFADGTQGQSSLATGLNYVWAVRDGSPEAITLLNVTYSDESVTSGPLVGGPLQDEVNATFALAGHLDFANLNLGLTDVLAASITFDDTLWTKNELTDDFNPESGETVAFSLITDATGSITNLAYQAKHSTAQNFGRSTTMNSNFSLRVLGTDPGSGDAYEYGYASSAQSLQSTPAVMSPRPCGYSARA